MTNLQDPGSRKRKVFDMERLSMIFYGAMIWGSPMERLSPNQCTSHAVWGRGETGSFRENQKRTKDLPNIERAKKMELGKGTCRIYKKTYPRSWKMDGHEMRTGHVQGTYQSYRKSIGKTEELKFWECRNVEHTKEHTICECRKWEREREAVGEEMGRKMKDWNKISKYIEEVLTKEERKDRQKSGRVNRILTGYFPAV